jgi:hypothetical protein
MDDWEQKKMFRVLARQHLRDADELFVELGEAECLIWELYDSGELSPAKMEAALEFYLNSKEAAAALGAGKTLCAKADNAAKAIAEFLNVDLEEQRLTRHRHHGLWIGSN